ncbi:MAG: PhnD/SsuA/transferrin family substrate-binding protein, partial [Dehalococcoidia bacterium]
MPWCRLSSLLLLLTVVASACSGSVQEPPIDLSAQPPTSPAPIPQTNSSEDLILAVAAVNSPLSTFALYEKMANFLGDRLEMRARLAGSRTYAEINSLVRSRDATLAIVCSAAYVYGHDEFGMEPVVVPVVDGKTIYYSYLIVKKDSPITDWWGLRGHIFAFSDPMSNSGRLVPLYQLWKMRETP